MTASALSLIAFEFTGAWIAFACFLVPVIILYVYAIISLIGRHDLGIGVKLVWLLAILALPLIGAILYFMLRPAPQQQNQRAQARRKH